MSKEKPITELKLSELVEQSLDKGVVPIVQFADIEDVLNQAYNTGIDHAIALVDVWYKSPSCSVADLKMLLSNLKKQQP